MIHLLNNTVWHNYEQLQENRKLLHRYLHKALSRATPRCRTVKQSSSLVQSLSIATIRYERDLTRAQNYIMKLSLYGSPPLLCHLRAIFFARARSSLAALRRCLAPSNCSFLPFLLLGLASLYARWHVSTHS